MKRTGLKRTTPLKAKGPIKISCKPMGRSMAKTNPARQAAKGRDCQIRVPGHCLKTNETVVLCHYRLNDGGGMKPDDEQAAFGCRTCHDLVDGRATCEFTHVELRLMHAEGVFRTQKILRGERLYFLGPTVDIPLP